VRKHLKTIALVLLTLVILWRLWRRLDWSEVLHSLGQASILLIAASVVASTTTNVVRAFRWRTLIAPLTPTHVYPLFAAINIGVGATFIFGSAAGEVARPLALPLLNPQVRRTTAFLTVIVERIFDLSVLCTLFGLGLLWFPFIGYQPSVKAHVTELGVALLALPPVALATLLLFRERLINRSNRIIETTDRKELNHGRIRRAGSRVLRQLLRALGVLTNAKELVVVMLWTAAQWSSAILGNWLVLRAFGVHFGAKETVLVMCFGLAGSFVPTPGGAAGAFHAALSGGLVLMGVALEKAAAISIAAHLVGFIPALAFGSYFLFRRGINLAQLQREMTAVGETR
jgi:uncharacterized protein (TIRG00374 family)